MSSLTIVIPEDAPAPPPAFGRKISAGAEWFKHPGKAELALALDAPSPLDPVPPYPADAAMGPPASRANAHRAGAPPGSPTPYALAPPLETPPPSPCLSAAPSSPSTPSTPATPSMLATPATPSPLVSALRKAGRRGQKHRRAPALSDAAALECPSSPRSRARARFPGGSPVSGVITPLWTLDDADSDAETDIATPVGTPDEHARLLDPFEMLLPYAQTKREHTYNECDLNEDCFLVAPPAAAGARHISLRAFRPRVPHVPRHRRPIVTVIACLLMFGSLLTCSIVQQAAGARSAAAFVRQAERTAAARAGSDIYTDVEPGVVPARPAHHRLGAAMPPAEPLTMTPSDELAALLSFVFGTAVNALPPADPAAPLDPDVFLPFDPASPTAHAEMAEVVRAVWDQNPVVVLGRMRDPRMRQARRLLGGYRASPELKFVEVDQRPDGVYLEDVLERLLGKADGPYVLLQGKLLGSTAKLAELEKAGQLVPTFSRAGAALAPKKKRNKHAREEERVEAERVLGPQAIAGNAA